MTQDALRSMPRIRAIALSEAAGQMSRDTLVLTGDGAPFESGTVLTQGRSATFAMDADAVGNPTAGAVAVGGAAISGAYRIMFENATHFLVEDPLGSIVAGGVVGTAFSQGGLTFTLTGGSADTGVNSLGTLTVANSSKFARYEAARFAGPAIAVLLTGMPAYTGDRKVIGFTRKTELNRDELTGLDSLAEADLRLRGLVVEGTPDLPVASTPTL